MRKPASTILLPVGLSLLIVGTVIFAVGRSRPLPYTGPNSITGSELREHVFYLADDLLSGRETGSSEIVLVEEYVAGNFDRIGLAPLPGEEDLFLEFKIIESKYDPEFTGFSFTRDGAASTAVPGRDFRPFGFSGEGLVEAEVVFAGYGITAPEYGYDDYAGLDVEGRIVLIMRHEPGENDPDSPFQGTSFSKHALFTKKAEYARQHGASGMLLYTDPLHHPPEDDLRFVSVMHPAGTDIQEVSNQSSSFLALNISRGAAERMTGEVSLEDLQTAVDGNTKPKYLDIGPVRASIRVEKKQEVREITARNVAGFLEGSDPDLLDEWIVVGGHHDHLGKFSGQGDVIYNGADDNASGTSGVLELAEAFSTLPVKPRRSMVFITFSGEEQGLLGSRSLVEKGMIPVEKVVFMLNLDMIGRNPGKNVQISGNGITEQVREIILLEKQESLIPFSLTGNYDLGNSDHDPFYRAGVPFLFFFTGEHDDYHRVTDHADRLEYERMTEILRLAYRIVYSIADENEPP